MEHSNWPHSLTLNFLISILRFQDQKWQWVLAKAQAKPEVIAFLGSMRSSISLKAIWERKNQKEFGCVVWRYGFLTINSKTKNGWKSKDKHLHVTVILTIYISTLALCTDSTYCFISNIILYVSLGSCSNLQTDGIWVQQDHSSIIANNRWETTSAFESVGNYLQRECFE